MMGDGQKDAITVFGRNDDCYQCWNSPKPEYYTHRC
jgi:hypothetical protein